MIDIVRILLTHNINTFLFQLISSLGVMFAVWTSSSLRCVCSLLDIKKHFIRDNAWQMSLFARNHLVFAFCLILTLLISGKSSNVKKLLRF